MNKQIIGEIILWLLAIGVLAYSIPNFIRYFRNRKKILVDLSENEKFEIKAKNKGINFFYRDKRLVFKQVNIRDEDFSHSKNDGLCVVESRFERCCFEGMKFDVASFGEGLKSSEYVDCSFDGSKIYSVQPGCSKFIRCSFRNINFKEFFCHDAEFVDCVFTGKIKSGFFNGTKYDVDGKLSKRKNEFHGNDFGGVEFEDLGFRTGIDLEKQKLPSGADYLYIPNAENIIYETKKRVVNLGWKDFELRQKTLNILKLCEDEIARGQKQLFFVIKNHKQDEIWKIILPIIDELLGRN